MAEVNASIRPPAPVAVFGLGNMGHPMAMNLVRSGFAVAGFDQAGPARAHFAATGGRAVDDVKAAVGSAEVVITLLPDGKVVRSAVEGMLPLLRKGTVIVDMSSSDPVGTRALGGELQSKGFPFIDAPVSGGVRRAVDGSLAIMAGGDGATIDRVEPVLSAMGKSIFRTGPLGSGHAMKALNNHVSGAGLIAALEALRVGRAFGIDPNVIVDVLNASTGRNTATENKLKQFVITETFAAGFSIGLMAKDVRAARDLAAATGVPAPLIERCAELWDDAARDLGGSADHTAIERYLAKLA
ncbi:MAG: NAD(P)-dependent oxidoreductase [Alphaproteobacteria bacterium]|nr:NAD(P)-dependent oxidoreductase [Alphaproteobacteria bacterium]